MAKKTPKFPGDAGFRYLDDEDRELIESIENDEYKRLPKKREEALVKKLRAAATNYRTKNARINIRMSDSDLLMYKRQAAVQGLPYQTLISSILHQYIAGHLKSAY